MALLCCWKMNGAVTNDAYLKNAGPRRFSYGELNQSTGGFPETAKLGVGGFGEVYKGVIDGGKTQVAVKKLSKTSHQGQKEFESEVMSFSQLGHKHLVKLIGWCQEKKKLLLVYEYMENGSLDLHLFKGKSLLPWDVRYRIATGLAIALRYLHEEWEKCVLHRDVKPSNIMLGNDYGTKLGDFGLARLVDHKKSVHTMTGTAGTTGYMAPEYISTTKASIKTDVYSFGAVVLEIACGRKFIDNTEHSQIPILVDWVWEHYGSKTLLEAADPLLGSNYDQEEIERMMIVGLRCLHPNPDDRPTIKQVLNALENNAAWSEHPLTKPLDYDPHLYRGRSFPSRMLTIEEGQSSSSTYNTAPTNLDSTMTVSNNAPPATVASDMVVSKVDEPVFSKLPVRSTNTV